jgi:hypothetical protein
MPEGTEIVRMEDVRRVINGIKFDNRDSAKSVCLIGIAAAK